MVLRDAVAQFHRRTRRPLIAGLESGCSYVWRDPDRWWQVPTISPVGTVRLGSGRPLTLFAPGGEGDSLVGRMRYADRVAGTKVGFAYEQSGHFESFASVRRQADRDAAEVRAVASEHHTTQAVGFSRGARAVVGALAEDSNLFARVALVIPPGGRAAGKYATWLESRTSAGSGDLMTEVLVVGHRGDQGHPARVAQQWAGQLNAHLELLPVRAVYEDVDRVRTLLAEFLN
jgi:hypothetical protein